MTIFMFYLCVISLVLPPITAIVVGIVETIKKRFTKKDVTVNISEVAEIKEGY